MLGTGCRSEPSAKKPASAQATRIVSLAPNVTEILFAVGAEAQVVGVTRFCDFPPRVKELPKVGGVVDPDVEAITALKPDLVIGVTSAGDPKIKTTLESLGIRTLFLKMETLDETLEGIKTIASATQKAAAGEEIASEMRGDIERYAKQNPPMDKRPSVLLLFGRNPLVAAGPNTYAHDLLTKAGGRNVLTGDIGQYPKLDIEKIIELNPDRIIDLAMTEEQGDQEFWGKFDSIHAVEHGDVYRFTDPAMMRPGPRLIDGFQNIAMAIRGKHGNH